MRPTRHCNASLALAPAAPQHCDSATLINFCQRIELTGHAIETGRRYYTGERFLDHISFMGCSPQIQFTEPPDGSHFTHIVLHQHAQPILFHGQHSRAPHCPQCNKTLADWNTHVSQNAWLCPHCEQLTQATDWRWHKTAGYARSLIEITDIYPKEAVPQPALLQQLADATGMEWGYFYY